MDADNTSQAARKRLEQELLKGLEGEDVTIDARDWESIEQEAQSLLDSRQDS